MTPLAWLLVAAVLIAWAGTALWEFIDRCRDQADLRKDRAEAEQEARTAWAMVGINEQTIAELREQLMEAADELEWSRHTTAAVAAHAEKRRAGGTSNLVALPARRKSAAKKSGGA